MLCPESVWAYLLQIANQACMRLWLIHPVRLTHSGKWKGINALEQALLFQCSLVGNFFNYLLCIKENNPLLKLPQEKVASILRKICGLELGKKNEMEGHSSEDQLFSLSLWLYELCLWAHKYFCLWAQTLHSLLDADNSLFLVFIF